MKAYETHANKKKLTLIAHVVNLVKNNPANLSHDLFREKKKKRKGKENKGRDEEKII
jgi:hypothetical protein